MCWRTGFALSRSKPGKLFGMTKKNAEQLRRAIARMSRARSDRDYVREHEPENFEKATEYWARCVRRLEALIDGLTDKPER